MNFPEFYQPDRIGTLFYPDVAAIAAEAATAELLPAAQDSSNVHLLIVDMQVDFCHQQGTLYVPGAEEDIRRLSEFIFTHAGRITGITCTLDSHLPFQIFHPNWWADAEGNHPAPFTLIRQEDVADGTWRPLVMPEFSKAYVAQLEEKAKKVLTIWPYHVLIGSVGNSLDATVWSAVTWHGLARKSQPSYLRKGRVPQSEYYSAIQPEIDVPDHPQGQLRSGVLASLAETDYLLVAGEAASHCVLETLADLVKQWDRAQLERVYVLRDCTSPVQHPEVDFAAIVEEQFAEFAAAGMQFVNSTDELSFLGETAEPAPPDPQTPVHGLQRMAGW
jgi:nicotinamidase/pyrazinamidase